MIEMDRFHILRLHMRLHWVPIVIAFEQKCICPKSCDFFLMRGLIIDMAGKDLRQNRVGAHACIKRVNNLFDVRARNLDARFHQTATIQTMINPTNR